jgi:hypothetical protein
MTIARVQSFAYSGIEAVPVEVQVQIASGLPAFLKVGSIKPHPMLTRMSRWRKPSGGTALKTGPAKARSG